MNIFRLIKRAAVFGLAFLIFFTNAMPLWAHPLGNFTINHYARLEPAAQQLRVRFVLDYAEIPTFQEKQRMEAAPDGVISPRARDAYLAARVPEIVSNLVLTIDHQPVALELVPGAAQLEFMAGQGGLQVMRLSMWLRAPLSANSSATVITFADKNFSERLGWREIVARAGDGITLKSSTVPTYETSQELTQYPADLNNPLDQRQATLVVIPGANAANTAALKSAAADSRGAFGVLDRTRDDFAKLITTDRELSPAVWAISLLAAIALGALHAFSPGHGKAVVGAYLVGSRGNWQHAVFLGSVVTATHTVGVYALGFVTLFLSAYILPEQLLPTLAFLSGLLVAIIGAQLFVQRWRAARTHTTSFDHARQHVRARDNGPTHGHNHSSATHVRTHADASSHSHSHPVGDAHEHTHTFAPTPIHTHAEGAAHTRAHATSDAHDHEHLDNLSPSLPHSLAPSSALSLSPSDSHTHDFATPEEEAAHAREHLAKVELLEKPSWRNLLSLGISGGLLPCPSALVVMLSAIGLGRVLFGLYLIVGFSLGLAGVLVLTGLALLYAGKFAGRLMRGERSATFFRYAPILGAAVVTVLGIGLALDALWQSGWFN